ncbi:MAG: hypothetical protein IJM67_01065, partial [Atopobiaceae bacterium]|nr:hypothetical protein [Atopobiaceae bacterium]
MANTNLTRRSFVAASALALSACANDAESEPEPAPSRERATYPFDFITTLGAFEGLTGAASSTPGTVDTLSYTCHAYAIEATDGVEDVMVDKALNVYLPADYDPARSYSVLYLLHGTGGMQDYWLGEPESGTDDYHGETTCNLLDTMHDQS